MKQRIKGIIEALKLAYSKLPKATIKVNEEFYYHFSRKHNKIPFIRNKEIAALIETYNILDYFASVRGKNSPQYYRKKALKSGYSFEKINRNSYLDDITEINNSKKFRQGQRMTKGYLGDAVAYEQETYGILFNKKLVAYLEVSSNDEIMIVKKIMGHADHLKHGIMYLLLLDVIINYYSFVKYIMYDTYLFNSDGMRLFKKRFQFKSMRVKWLLD